MAVQYPILIEALAQLGSARFRHLFWLGRSRGAEGGFAACSRRILHDSGLQRALQDGDVLGEMLDDRLRLLCRLLVELETERNGDEYVFSDAHYVRAAQLARDILPYVIITHQWADGDRRWIPARNPDSTEEPE